MKSATCVLNVVGAAAFCSLTLAGFAQQTERVSVDSTGVEGNSFSQSPSISADGRFVAFQSRATNLVTGDVNGLPDVFVRDRLTGQTTMASVSSAGVMGNSTSITPLISADGRFIVFQSLSNNLVAGDTNNHEDIFVRDLLAGVTTRASVDGAGVQGNLVSTFPAMSSNGRFVTFQSTSTNLVATDTNFRSDIFLHDNVTGSTALVSVDSTGLQANLNSFHSAVSADGRYVAFSSLATNLVTGDTNGQTDVFLHDMQTGVTTRVSVDSNGAQAFGGSDFPSISDDGRWIAFASLAPNLVAGDTNAASDAFVHDTFTGQTLRVSVDSNGLGGNDGTLSAAYVSAGGQFVTFASLATNLVAGDTNAFTDVFVRDLQTGQTTLESVDTNGMLEDGAADFAISISSDGRFVAFASNATNLVTNDTNASVDAFVRDRGPLFSAILFCSGDGSGTACPCGNSGTAGEGCLNSLGSGGALTGSGSASITLDTFVLSGSGMPSSSALYFQGTTQSAGGAGVVFGDGLRCAGGTIVRLATKVNAGGASSYPGAGDPTVSVRGLIPASGGTRTYQVWYRNAAPFCTPSTFNLTNGIEVAWAP